MKTGRLAGAVIPVAFLIAWGAFGTGRLIAELYFHGPPFAESALQWATPDPKDQQDPSAGMLEFSATRLKQLKHGSVWGPIDYIAADVPSTRPDMVSVNPIDKYTWGAAAYSVRTARCYLILVAEDPNNPRYGATYYGRLAVGATCVGAAASRAMVTSTNEPPE